MTRGEARLEAHRAVGSPGAPGPEEGGPDPTEDPILYLQEPKEDEE